MTEDFSLGEDPYLAGYFPFSGANVWAPDRAPGSPGGYGFCPAWRNTGTFEVGVFMSLPVLCALVAIDVSVDGASLAYSVSVGLFCCVKAPS